MRTKMMAMVAVVAVVAMIIALQNEEVRKLMKLPAKVDRV